MPKSRPGDSDLSEYAMVADRITLFYQRYPTGRIITELHSRTEREITFLACVFRGPEDTKPAATGWASERQGDGEINEVACLENTETSAIGRALANLGFTASTRRPSREEMQKAARERVRLRGERRSSAGADGREPLDANALQRRANAVHDVLDLLARAEAAGFPERRAAVLRAAVLRPELTPRAVLRLVY
jgi:hypothetical protein